MAIYITVDGGTTNTRAYLVRDGKICDSFKLNTGARNGRGALTEGLRVGIRELLLRNSLSESEIERIIASGMITSENGLCDLPHITLPAGLSELNSAMHHTVFEDISSIGWSFVRGVKSVGETIEKSDIIRGEETELMGILDSSASDALYILPGSHSKHMSIDKSGRITEFKTMMSGELFAAVIENTILKNSTGFDHATIEREYLLRGYGYCAEHGINEALFKTRILRNVFFATAEQCYSFLLGVVLCDEVREIIKHPATTVVIGGQKQMREALAIMLESSGKSVTVPSDEKVSAAVALGAVRIYEAK
ncbi:MAG: hypothetical protein E7649_05495 [Ruminococcaceae bacterium]|nr:hypothetical protein [Oscillospiraceae bacterium]